MRFGESIRFTDRQKYLASLLSIGVVTLLLVGLIGGWVALHDRNEDGSAGLISGVVIVVIALLGWNIGYRVRERYRLRLPLWGGLDEEQARLLAQYRQWRRSGKIGEPPSSEVKHASRSVAGAAMDHVPGLSKRDRQRRAQVQAQLEQRRAKERGQD
ncbi:Uncharacterised protein [Actinomyces bovis]|uniref:Uncharacterized protein n=1 Tax=Actinomyces bovis TaxID=1658 RepID=A0ABY1VQE9_9ACTO|nr:hypothetical protein [Actinomyces bovis]SPT53871.1 Uncharacterised protein [Actinomyces bovis]VEG53288.1 Uncharacterised protein [Actinomyces israelii]